MRKVVLLLVLSVSISVSVQAQTFQTARQKAIIEKQLNQSIIGHIWHQTTYFIKNLARTVTMGTVVIDGKYYTAYKDLDNGDVYLVDGVVLMHP